MRLHHLFEKEKLELPDLEVGDEIKVGKFKNRKAEITGFDKDEHNQPVMKTTKGDHKVFKNRHSKLEEAFTNPYPIKIQNTGKNIVGTARLDDGSTLEVKVWANDDIFDLEFERNGSMDLTGGGDQYRIFATVMDAIKQIVNKYHPKTLRFSAEKEDGYSGEETGRAKLYTRMVNKFASSLGYTANVSNDRYQTNFILTANQSEQVNEITMDHRTSKGDFNRSDLDEFIDRAYPVGNVKGFKIFLFDEDEPEEMHYLVGDPNSEGFLGYVSLIFGDRDKFYRTNVFFDPEIQGKGLAVPLYAFAIKHSGQTVVSDLTQTKGSKQLWQKLAKTPGINVYAWNIRTDEYSHYDPDVETDEEIWADTRDLSNQHAELLRKIRELDHEFGQYEMSEEEYEEARARLIKMTQDIQNQGPSGRNDVRLVATTK